MPIVLRSENYTALFFDLSYSMQISWYFSGYMKGEDHGNTRI